MTTFSSLWCRHAPCVWTCAVPSDVIEDVLYESMVITTTARSDFAPRQLVVQDRCRCAADDLRRTIAAEQLTGAGWNEILNNSLTAESYYEGPCGISCKQVRASAQPA